MEFRNFVESLEDFDKINVEIPVSKNIHKLSKLFRDSGEKLFLVGGAVRDFLFYKFHGKKGDSFNPKDFDVATQASPDTVQDVLNSPESKSLGITSFPKGEAFGVISAIVDGEEIEIATFREESYNQDGDGRRPDEVKFSTPGKDAQRRDLTINALFYDIEEKEIRDYNLDKQGNGQGIQDIQNNTVRPVGDPRERFREDKLRVARLVRFFSRFNPGEIKDHLTPDIIDAIDEFKSMEGVSSERICQEFISGLGKAQNPVNYLKNWDQLGLYPFVFPGLNVNVDSVERVKNNNIKAVLAWILRDNDPKTVRSRLQKLSYPSEIFDYVAMVLSSIQKHGEDYFLNNSQISHLIKRRDLYKQADDVEKGRSVRKNFDNDFRAVGDIFNMQTDVDRMLRYDSPINSADYMHLPPNERGKAMKRDQESKFSSFK